MNKMNMMKYLGSESSWLSGCAGATPVARTLECGTTRAAVPKFQMFWRRIDRKSNLLDEMTLLSLAKNPC